MPAPRNMSQGKLLRCTVHSAVQGSAQQHLCKRSKDLQGHGKQGLGVAGNTLERSLEAQSAQTQLLTHCQDLQDLSKPKWSSFVTCPAVDVHTFGSFGNVIEGLGRYVV